MSNTKLRIFSAMVILLLVIGSLILGKNAALMMYLLFSVLCLDEFMVHFSDIKRKTWHYNLIFLIFLIFFLTINVFFEAKLTRLLFTISALLLNVFLIFYLFKIPLKENFMKKSALANPGILSLIIILPILSFSIYFESEYWRQNLGLLLVVNYGMDTGAWFFGKNFGRHKLMPQVSPKKTTEGLIGGMVISAILGTIAWRYLFNNYQWYYSVIFALCGAASQVGDLIQSKIKREFNIKDSSHLIPGHGGIYDRIDSLIFLSPFFVFVVKYLGRH